MKLELDMPPEAWEIQQHLNEVHLHEFDGRKVAIHGPQPYEVLNAVAMSISEALQRESIMAKTKHFEVTLKLKTIKDPKELVEVISKVFYDEAFHVMSYDYDEIAPRELSAEHHGGYQES